MVRLFSRLIFALVLGSAICEVSGAAVRVAQAEPSERRVALVIGNSSYAAAPLANPVNDARSMVAALKRLGFEVIHRENATKQTLENAIGEFGEKLSGAGVGLFFYAGHGMQVAGRNFLIPVDATISSEQRVRLENVDLDVVMDQMNAARSRVNILILDACRNNPFERRFRSAGGGLAQVNAPEGTLIAYATAPGKVAADGDGPNGLYTGELLKAMAQPGLSIESVFKTVRANVTRKSSGGQTPWESSSLMGDFYFLGSINVEVNPPREGIATSAVDNEREFWEAVKDSSDPGSFEAYLRQYPQGVFAELARYRIEQLRKPRVALAAPPPPASQGAASPQMQDVEPLDATYVVIRRANVRNEPSAKATLLRILERGTKITVTGTVRTENWYRVRLDSKQSGWIFGEAIKDIAQTEREEWDRVKGSTDLAVLSAFLSHFPAGTFAEMARARQAELEAQQRRPIPAVAPPKLPPTTEPAVRRDVWGLWAGAVSGLGQSHPIEIQMKSDGNRIVGSMIDKFGGGKTVGSGINGEIEGNKIYFQQVLGPNNGVYTG